LLANNYTAGSITAVLMLNTTWRSALSSTVPSPQLLKQ